MTKAEFEKLVTEYGNAAFDCGYLMLEEGGEDRFEKRVAAKQAVLDAYMEKEKS